MKGFKCYLNRKETVRALPAVLLAFLFSCFMFSCSKKSSPVYSHFVNVDKDGWENGEYCIFNIVDGAHDVSEFKNKRYDILLTLRHTTDYPYNNLWVVFEEAVTPDSVIISKYNLKLASSSGSWLGHGSHGIYEFTDTLSRNISLSPSAVFSLRHDMPVSSLPGILDVGLTVIPSL